MTNIWGFWVQTMSVSFIAGIVLLLKYIMKDKLSPRWQYGVWSVLLASVLIPVHMSRYIFPQLYIWIETGKAIVEKKLTSNFTSVYEPIRVNSIFPFWKGIPKSITDWLMIIYIIGILFMLLRYIIAYFRLFLLLKQGEPASHSVQVQFDDVCETYHMKPCNIIAVEGIGSAFVCGIIHPILVIPKGYSVDNLILLHELLHLKYKDILQNIVWCMVRVLHWCNPFLQYVCNQIENDMESLCDQRVLECLEGEERRQYGTILLNMANDTYAHIPGTSSISNGGKNISRRIEAIVRFKKYPKGMALVSVCIILVLFSLLGSGNTYTYRAMDYQPGPFRELEKAMAMARLNRCTTIAGALDTYAKGLMLENGIYIATASSLSMHDELESKMYHNSKQEGWAACYLDSGEELEDAIVNSGYHILNLTKVSEECYHAYIAISIIPDGEDYYAGQSLGHTVLIPVEITKEDAWVVRENGVRTLYETYLDMAIYESDFPAQKHYYGYSEKAGEITGILRTVATVNNTISTNNIFGTNTDFDETPKTDAEFAKIEANTKMEYTVHSRVQNQPKQCITVITYPLKSEDDTPVFPETVPYGINSVGSSTDGYEWESKGISENYNGIVHLYTNAIYDSLEEMDDMKQPYAHAVQIYWDFAFVDELIIREVP